VGKVSLPIPEKIARPHHSSGVAILAEGEHVTVVYPSTTEY